MYSASSKLEEAAELFQKAGNIYKANKQSTGATACSSVHCVHVCVVHMYMPLSAHFVSRRVRHVHS